MDKKLVLMGIALMAIGIGFGAAGIVDVQVEFWQGASIWTVGGIAMISGITIFNKEEGFLAGK
ncbi:hypothetical protein [Nitrosopumilus sp. b1]|uniref:hypothetical protein n=1 Tax=Nitrosopumilus sp. b1 TaxID=2109907 RepID=UPI0015F5D56B|nr:hypothetical protein [Nitrosopumilus sp. b1]